MAGKLGDFCSIRCREDTYKAAPAILEVPSSQAEYRSVADQFKDQWKHSATPPGVVAVYKVYSHPTHVQSFLAYKKAVGNSRRRWHGTTRQCCIGDDSRNTGFCTKTGCSICSILQNSFQVAKARNGMFGVGVYTSATSSKSNGYIQNLGGSNYRAILLTEVIMGKVCKMTTNSSGLTQAPAGYDSVVGEPGTGLSHDEAIVYKNEAIRPLYLVIFQS
ncbi:PARP catalytic domain-containing protein [Phanerochaete sordida]|uniref:PARP catalytic domain-containing protein n=1 Tax=Phanerochaete sordida TaxID=48140 RepID=A0A9P3GLM9_9APHY|nr:PARP catalytic domain-containing protein [Phanerochaete sordida]